MWPQKAAAAPGDPVLDVRVSICFIIKFAF